MRLKHSRAAALGIALLFSGEASAQEWFDAYERGLLALKQAQAARAVEFFEQAIRLRPEPGKNLISYGTNRIDEYYPYLRLAEAEMLSGNLIAAREALKRSEAHGKEPRAERARLAQLVETAESARVVAPAPALALPVPSPSPISLVAEPVVLPPSPLPTSATPISTPAATDSPQRRTPGGKEPAPKRTHTPGSAAEIQPSPSLPVAVLSPTFAPSPLTDSDKPGIDQASAGGGTPGIIALGLTLLVLAGLGAIGWVRARGRVAHSPKQAAPYGGIETREIAGLGSGLQGAGNWFGPYLLLEPLGKGGMAVVFKAEHNGEICALKRPLAAFLGDPEFLERFAREAEIGRTLHHPNIVRIYDRGDVGGIPYFTMEIVMGRTLETLLRERGVLEPTLAAKIVSQVAEALDYAHLKGVIHRDLKPSNIMIEGSGLVKVMDYGIARAQRFDGLTIAGTFLGTPEYAAPETAQGTRSDARSDLYALGIILYEMVTGKKPFVGDTPFLTLQKQCSELPVPPSVLTPAITKAIEAIILRLLSKEPSARYPGAEELLIDLRQSLNRKD